MTATMAPPARIYSPISTQKYHSLLTKKQGDVLLMLTPMGPDETWPWATSQEIDGYLNELITDWINNLDELGYWTANARNCLRSLERRGLVMQVANHWMIHPNARQRALKEYC
jgi:hypothetical protein